MLKVLLLRYNKVHDHSLEILYRKLRKNFDLMWGSLPAEKSVDLLSQNAIDTYLDPLDVNAVVIGDVFWPTGQRICASCNARGIKTFFLQHGQWIYVNNKKSLKHYPSHTMLFGKNAVDMCSSWPYSKHSKVSMTGSPRYDSVNGKLYGGSYIYFSPPVIEELVHGRPCGQIRQPSLRCLEKLRGIDGIVPMIVQPHYREARIEWLRRLFPKAQFADPDLDPLCLISGSKKVVASRNSTVVLDAIAYKKTTVLIDLLNEDVGFFKRGHFGEFALESADREQFIRNVVTDVEVNYKNGYAKRAQEHIYLGDASERIGGIIQHEFSSSSNF